MISRMKWPPKKVVKYEFNDLSKECVIIKAEEGSQRPNQTKEEYTKE